MSDRYAKQRIYLGRERDSALREQTDPVRLDTEMGGDPAAEHVARIRCHSRSPISTGR